MCVLNIIMKLLVLLGLYALASAEQVCFKGYVPPCFTADEPFNQPLVQLPELPSRINTSFWLYTHRNPGKPQYMHPLDSAANLTKTNFDPANPTSVIAHGYLGNTEEFWVVPLIEALLKKGDRNVIVIDWARGSTFPYVQAVGNSRLVGRQAKMLLMTLHSMGMKYSDVHLIGQGLGSHMFSYVGSELNVEVAGGNKTAVIGRISAMDPVGPFFEGRDPAVKIDPTDAQFVDAIHTDTETIKVKGIGTKEPVGHMDFFPNGGHSQPGCWSLDKGVVKWLACSHYRSMELFTESIHTSCPFRAYKCKSYTDFDKGLCSYCPPGGCPSMGWNSEDYKQEQQGVYYARTNDASGFCTHHYQIKFMTSSGVFADFNGEVMVTLSGIKGTETVTLPKHYYPAGATETLLMHTKQDLGQLEKIKVEHSRWIDNWNLYATIIRPLWEEKAQTGCFKRWVSSSDPEVNLQGGVEGNCPEE